MKRKLFFENSVYYASLTILHYVLQIYPLWFRAHGVAISTSFNWALNLVVSFTFLYLLQVIFYL